MAEDTIDLRYLGHQMQRLQEDVRNLQAEMRGFNTGEQETFQAIVKIEGELHGLQRELQKLEAAHVARFKQAHSTIAVNTEYVLRILQALDDRYRELVDRVDRLEAGQQKLEASQQALEAGQQRLERRFDELKQIVIANHTAVMGLLQSRPG